MAGHMACPSAKPLGRPVCHTPWAALCYTSWAALCYTSWPVLQVRTFRPDHRSPDTTVVTREVLQGFETLLGFKPQNRRYVACAEEGAAQGGGPAAAAQSPVEEAVGQGNGTEDSDDEVVASTALSEEELDLLAPYDEPALIKCGLQDVAQLQLGDDSQDHIAACQPRAYKSLQAEQLDAPDDCRYAFTTTDGGLTESIEYCGTTGAACITKPCRGELASAVDMGQLHLYGHGFESAIEQAEPNMSALLTEAPLPPWVSYHVHRTAVLLYLPIESL